MLLVLAVVAELVRWWPRLGRSERVAGIGAVAAPFVGLLAFLAWSKHTVGDWLAPLRVQLQSSHHGGLSDPFATLYDDATRRAPPPRRHRPARAVGAPGAGHARRLLAPPARPLHAVRRWRSWPTAVAGSNLDSFERYALSAFPLSMAAALVLTETQVERAVLALLAAGLAGYALLAFLNISVP